MGWSCCMGYSKSIGAKVGLMIKEYNRTHGTRLSVKPLSASQLGHESRYDANAKNVDGYPDGYCDDCTRITHIKISLANWFQGSEEYIEAPFKCACHKARKPEVIHYKGFSIYIRYTKRKWGKYYKVLVSQDAGTQQWANYEGFAKEAIVDHIKKLIRTKKLKNIYGEIMK